MDRDLAERILDVVRGIPAGRVATYGDIAARAGSASPRFAGWVLAQLGDEGVPWHRVVRADGHLVAGLRQEQQSRLRAEGVVVEDGRIDLARYRMHD